MAQTVKNLPALWETWLQSLGWEDSPGGGQGNSLRYSCLEYPHGQRSLAGYRPCGHKELDTTEHTDQNLGEANTPRPDQGAAGTQSLLCVLTQVMAPPHPRGSTATSISEGHSAAPNLLLFVVLTPPGTIRRSWKGRSRTQGPKLPSAEERDSRKGFPGGPVIKTRRRPHRRLRFSPGMGKIPGEGNGSPLQCSRLGNPMDSRAWRATVHGVARSWT